MPGPPEAGSIWVAASGGGDGRRKGEAVPVVKGFLAQVYRASRREAVGRWK
jgi:hypothetical protein